MIEILVCFADLPLCSVKFIKELWNLQIYLMFFFFFILRFRLIGVIIKFFQVIRLIGCVLQAEED